MGMYGVLKRVSQLEAQAAKKSADRVEKLLAEPSLELGKTWDALHLLLTGTQYGGDGPLANAVLALEGQEVGEDSGYGPARLLSPKQVADVAAALESFGVSNLRARHTSGLVARSSTHGGYGEAEDLEELEEAFEQLLALYQQAAQAKAGMLQAVV